MTLRETDPQPSPAPAETIVTRQPIQDTTERISNSSSGDVLVVTETLAPPGSVATSRTIIHQRRRSVALVTQGIWFVVGIFEVLLALRLVLLFSGANPEASFTQLIFGVTKPLVFVFLGIFPNIGSGGFAIEPASLVAMLIYFLLGMGSARLAWILYGEPKETT